MTAEQFAVDMADPFYAGFVLSWAAIVAMRIMCGHRPVMA